MLKKLNPLLHSQLRLAVMSILMQVEHADFNYLLEQTDATSGNLSVQLSKLEENKYITIKKSFKNKKPLTRCAITPTGRSAIEEYVQTLKTYLPNSNQNTL
jgi:DNA-binding MarR family transcriptional regulator